jgi:hypothetical protein
MADDLRRHVNRGTILARRAGPLARAARWVRRRPGLAAALAALFLALQAMAFFAFQAKRAEDRLLAEQGEAALEKAILEALGGDSQAALVAINRAETRGVSPGQLNLLRGLVEHQRGNSKEAIVHLEHADTQLSRSVAAKALLAQAYLDAGQFALFDATVATLETLQPRTNEDYLFLALAQSSQDPDLAIRALDQARPRLRQSSVRRLVRAQAWSWRAVMTARALDAEKALEEVARVDLPDNPLLGSIRLQAHLAAATAAGRDTPAARSAALKQAAEAAAFLERYPEAPVALAYRCWYHLCIDDDEGLLRVVGQDRPRGDFGLQPSFEAHVYYRRKQFREALERWQKGRTRGHDFDRLYLLATLPGHKEETEKLFLRLHRSLKGGSASMLTPTILGLLGPRYREKACQARRELRRRAGLVPAWRNRWYHDLLAYNAGLLKASDLLARCGESRLNQCEAYFYIGLNALVEGDRAEAQRCFVRCVETEVFPYVEYMWSRAFLACIDDPRWLPWLTVKKPAKPAGERLAQAPRR